MKKKLLVGLSWLLIFSMSTQAQSLFGEVVTVLENNGCTNGYCHGNNAGGLDLSGSNTDIYNNLVGITPSNEAAMMKGDLLIAPGYPERSFLYRKVNKGAYHDSDLTGGEMDAMPPNDTELSARDKEVIRQWIYFGAKQSGNPMGTDNFQAMEDYFADGGIDPVERPEPPAEGEGFQVHLGPVFLPPGEEVEYLKKFELQLEENTEVNRIELFMSDFSHHFILYKFKNEEVANYRKDGVRVVSLAGENPFGSDTELVSVWQDDRDFILPEGTAFKWRAGTELDMNYHILNYSTTNVLAADVYFNVYTQEDNTAIKEMFSGLMLNLGIYIKNDNKEDVETDVIDLNFPYNIWAVSSHTHKYGKDFDVYLENQDGSKGMQIFEGKYDSDYTSPVDVYDYAHPPFRTFDKFLRIPPSQDLIQEAVYINDGPRDVNFGITTDDEMMLTALLYTRGDDHQELAEFNELPDVICFTDGPVEILKNYESGAVGNGVIGNMFYPELAGIGSHMLLVNCCEEDQLREVVIEVIPYSDLDLAFSVDYDTNPPLLTLDPIAIDGPFTIQWYLNGAPIDGAVSDILFASENGEYQAEITKENECPSRSEKQTVETSVGSGLDDVNAHSVVVAPNPFVNHTNVAFTLEENANVVIEIVNVSGKVVQSVVQENLNIGDHTTRINLDLVSGMYFINLKINGELSAVEKVIKN